MNKKSKENHNCEIAIVGVGCYYPGAHSPLELWENILSRKQQFREMPDVRLPNKEYYDADPTTPDKTYQNKAAVIDGYEFNWLDRRIPKKTFESTDIVHWLALDTALQALENSGYKKENLPQEKMGVVLGNTLTGEFTRSNQMLLRWPYVRKTLRASLKAKGLSHLAAELEGTMEKMYKSVFAPVTEDTLAGGLANTIAGRVCNYLDIHGGGYIVDGACSSSLLAITTGANYLELGQMDVVIAGGVDVSLDTFELIGFAKTGALTQDEMRVYDKKGKGFLPGEGCGMVIMKRMDDAIRDGDKILATLMGWGISSDGKGGITAPSAVGQSKALLRAYRKANFDTAKLDFIEGHGTGTTVGDKTELAGITLALNADKELPKRSCGVTSFKSIVGHTKAAAGVGAFIKTVIALNQRVLPPTAGLREFNPIFEDDAKTIYPLTYGEVRDPESTIYAGVSAMGFGGINSHTLLRSGDSPLQELKPSIEERKLLVSNQESEVFIFSADSIEEIINDLDLARYISQGISYAELVDFAYYLNTQVVADYKYRAAIVANNPFDLARKLNLLIDKLKGKSNDQPIQLEAGAVVFGLNNPNVKIGAAFPGQGAQRLNMSYKLKERYNWVEELFKSTDILLEKEGFEPIGDKVFRSIEKIIDQTDKLKWNDVLKQTKHAQPAIVAASLAWYKFLKRIGVEFDYSIGHSLGELTSFFAAGHFDEDTLLKFAGFRGQTMANCGSGTMASLVCSKDIAKGFIEKVKGYVTIANINAPEQTVLSGDVEAINEIVKLAEEEHIAAVKLPVSAAFHSKLIGETAEAIKNYKPLSLAVKDEYRVCRVVSSVSSEVVKEVDLNEYFANQSVSQVNFIDAVNTIKDKCDIMVEVGPGKVLSGLISNITQDINCFPVAATINTDTSLNIAIANLYVSGANINVNELYAERLIRNFTPIAERKFLVNPLERPFPQELLASTEVGGAADLTLFTNHIDFEDADLGDYMAARGAFVREVIAADLKHYRPTGSTAVAEQPLVRKVAATTAPALQESNVLAAGFEASLYNKLEEVTGFPASGFNADMKLLDDFNLDSIKAGTLLAGLTKEFNVQGKVNGAEYANATLSQIVDAFEKVLPKQVVIQQEATAESIEDTVLSIVEDKTGFPKEAIKMDFRLLDDLNLDSIKAGTLMAELVKKYNLTGKIEASAHANASLQQIVDKIKEFAPEQSQGAVSQPKQDVSELVYAAVEEKTGFGRNDLQADFKLLDDLNLDSIKAGSLLAELSKELNIQGKLEAAKFANARIEEIIQALEAETTVNDVAPVEDAQMPEGETPWVNAFEVRLSEFISNGSNKANYFENKDVVILKDDFFVPNIKKQIKGAKVINTEELTHIEKADILLIPLFPGKTIDEIKQTAKILAAVATNSNLRSVDICFVQQGDGSFYRLGKTEKINCLSAVGFASSMHLERPNQKIRVIEFGNDFSEGQFTQELNTILSGDASFEAVAVSGQGRFIMEYSLAAPAEKRAQIELNKSDVVLITGGAKGITAECGFALSKKFNCKMALIGSSKLSSDSGEIYDTLKRYADNGLTARYYSCNISNFDDVESLKQAVEKELGTVSAIIHGAGRNVPRLAESVNGEDAISEISPKVFGTSNLIQCFKGNALKQFTAFTSIIGVTGMQGNSWYSFANETTDLLLREFGNETGVPTLTLAYSVWSDVGMGARMGSVETLSHMGIGAISPDKGIKHFMKWFENPASDQQVVVASRLGGLDTWRRGNKTIPEGNRYLQTIKYFEPGVELVAQAQLNRKDDLYTDDHNYRGSLLFPTVFGLEAMAQAAAALAGYSNIKSVVLENITLLKPIVVPDKGNTTIQIVAERMEDSFNDVVRMKVGISTEDSDFTDNHFTTEVLLGIDIGKEEFKIETGEKLKIDPKTDLYSWLLFQGKTFQLIDSVYTISEKQAIFKTKKLSSDTSEICLSEEKQSPFLLGSPLLRDTLLQSFQLSLTRKLVLPVRIKRWAMYNTGMQTDGGLVQCDFVNQEGKTYDCNVTYTNETGELVELIEGYQVQELGDQSSNPTPEQIAKVNKVFKEKLENHLQGLDETIQFPAVILHKEATLLHTLSTDERHNLEQEVLLQNADFIRSKGFETDELTLQFLENGKPSLGKNDVDISISHTNTWLLMSVGNTPQGCDIELVQHRDEDIWKEMLGQHLFSLANTIRNDSESKDLTFTRLWSASEVAYKLYGKSVEEVSQLSYEAGNAIFELSCDGKLVNVLTFPLEVFPGLNMIFAMSVNQEIQEGEKAQDEEISNIESINNPQIELYNRENGKFEHDFLVTFKDCRGFYGKTYFTNFPLWMGSLRENVLSPIKNELLHDLSSGDYGMVTNDSSVHVYNEAESCENLIGTMSFTDKCDFENSFMDFKYEWMKETQDGKLIKIADCYLSTTWVKILDRGIVKKDPLPDYFVEFLNKYHAPDKVKDYVNLMPGQQFFDESDLGKVLYQGTVMPRPEVLLLTKEYSTGMHNGNSVGNLYYSNYYDWQAKTIESYLYNIVPEVYMKNGREGEYFCYTCNVNHLQEAMPFENIEVKMYLERVNEHSVTFFFEYFSLGNGERRKLSYGSNTLIWCSRDSAEVSPAVMSNPQELIVELKKHNVL